MKKTKIFKQPLAIINYAGTNCITEEINSWNSVKKIVKKVKQTFPNTKVVLSNQITRNDKKDLDKKMQDVNNRLKNYCMQTKLDYIEKNNIKEEHLGNKKLHLNKKRNTVFANNLLKYLRAAFWNVDFANCFLEWNLNINLTHSMNLSIIFLLPL